MSDPTTTNTVATGVNAAISTAGGDIVSTAEAMAVADVPMLGWPGIKQIWEAIFGWISGYFIKAAENGATFLIVDVQVGSEEEGISQALTALVTAEKSGDASAIQTAIQNYADAQSALVHDDGSAAAH